MTAAGPMATTIGEGRYVRANGTDIYYVEAGQGEPLLLLHGGLVSNGAAWDGSPIAYVSHLATFAPHFRVIAPDTRGHGRTSNPERGAISYAQLVDDVVALIDALGLERPLLCGFSDGGCVGRLGYPFESSAPLTRRAAALHSDGAPPACVAFVTCTR